jgi:hypothetical protein
MELLISAARKRSRGPFLDPPVLFYPNLMVGPGMFLHPRFVFANGITHIINVGEAEAAPEWVKRAFASRYTHLPISDDDKTQLMSIYLAFEQTLLKYMKDPNARMIYVHCMAGMNRSASLTAMFVMRQSRTPLEAIMLHSLRVRPCMYANPHFNAQLAEFAKKHVKK